MAAICLIFGGMGGAIAAILALLVTGSGLTALAAYGTFGIGLPLLAVVLGSLCRMRHRMGAQAQPVAAKTSYAFREPFAD